MQETLNHFFYSGAGESPFPSPRKTTIAVFHALKLGDSLCVIPAFRALRRHFPDAHISWIGHSCGKYLSTRFAKYVDEYIPFPGHRLLAESANAESLDYEAFIEMMREKRLDLVINLHGNGSITNGIIGEFYARFEAGFTPNAFIHDNRRFFIPFDESRNEIKRSLDLLEQLGVRAAGDAELEFPLTEKDWLGIATLRQCGILPIHPYICIHPGASTAEKRWRPECFAEVAQLAIQSGFEVILTGNAQEMDVARKVSGQVKGRVHDVCDLNLPLGILATLIKNSALLVCNDTGVSHLAAALHVPSVVIFQRKELLERWRPLNQELHRSFIADSPLCLERVLGTVIENLRRHVFIASAWNQSRGSLAS